METAKIPSRELIRIGENILPLVGNDTSQRNAKMPSANEINDKTRTFFDIGEFYFICQLRHLVLLGATFVN